METDRRKRAKYGLKNEMNSRMEKGRDERRGRREERRGRERVVDREIIQGKTDEMGREKV